MYVTCTLAGRGRGRPPQNVDKKNKTPTTGRSARRGRTKKAATKYDDPGEGTSSGRRATFTYNTE